MNLGIHNNLAHGKSPWEQSPRKLISLWDMMAFNFHDLRIALRAVEEELSRLKAGRHTNGPAGVLTKEEIDRATASVKLAAMECADCKFEQSRRLTTNLGIYLMRSDCTYQVVERDMDSLFRSMLAEIGKRGFTIVPPDKVQFFDAEELFGEAVTAAFPSAKTDIQDAGFCLAQDLHTAAVFHLMRIVEHAMRSLARSLRITRVRKKPLESCGWDDIISAIRAVQDQRHKKYSAKPRKSRRELDALRFYDAAADELNVFKEIWRNATMHTRAVYNEQEAQGVYIRVRDFTQRLAKQVARV
jgi:hypothetical protein